MKSRYSLISLILVFDLYYVEIGTFADSQESPS
jgi:hypothetical protein